MKKLLETGNNNHLMSLLMLSEDKLSGLCYLNGITIQISIRGYENNLLEKYNYIFGQCRKLSNYLNDLKKELSLKGKLKIETFHYDDKSATYSAKIIYVTLHNEDFSIGEDNWVYFSNQAVHIQLKHFKVLETRNS